MASKEKLIKLGIEDWSDLVNDFTDADLLLGNGFSLNLAGHFDYTSLFQEFLGRCSSQECQIFRSFGTNNFEHIQETLLNAKKVNKIFEIRANRKINDAISRLRQGLLESISGTHPSSAQIDWNQLQQLSGQLSFFRDIFTLNYDLFLYYLILQMKDEAVKQNRTAPYSDYFWGDYNDQFKQFMDYDSYHSKHLYYLHGALFLFNKPPTTLKLIRGAESKELVTMIGEVIRSGTMPLFVSEGLNKDKLKAIERSDYLDFCYESLKKSENKLVIFGSSLSKQDAHIIAAINYRQNKRKLAFSIYGGNRSISDIDREISRIKGKFPSHKCVFFDSETIFCFQTKRA